jgi:outer membrane receptor protein involved in Fe transport
MPKSVQGMPGYTWLPTTGNLKPQSSWQTSAGFNWQKGKLNVDAEIYYKWLENIAGNYLYPSKLYQSTQWYDIIEQGNGRAYGLDILSQYVAKEFQINLKYSLSKAEHSFSSVLNGQWIPADYDIRHDFSLTGLWTVQENEQKKKWFSGNFALHSGIPISLPIQSIKSMMPVLNEENYHFDFSYFDYYKQPNNARIKLYHRLDFGFNMEKKLNKGNRTWSVGVINAYNRQNPYSIYKDGDGNFKQLVLFPIMPFVSFKRSF